MHLAQGGDQIILGTRHSIASPNWLPKAEVEKIEDIDMKLRWLEKQILITTTQWDKSLTFFYPETKIWMRDAESYCKHLTQTCNYLNAAKLIDWDKYLVPSSRVLDVGCGGGWLTAFLSKNNKINQILSIDSSLSYLDDYLPMVVNLLGGDINKVETIQGLFSPIILEDESIDTIVISSALHHADNINTVLVEFYRVLKPVGYLMILNETPVKNLTFIIQTLKAVIKIFLSIILKRYQPYLQKVSAGAHLNNPYLGDVDYPDWYWQKAISASGFDLVEYRDSKLPTISGLEGRSLKHFICKKLK